MLLCLTGHNSFLVILNFDILYSWAEIYFLNITQILGNVSASISPSASWTMPPPRGLTGHLPWKCQVHVHSLMSISSKLRICDLHHFWTWMMHHTKGGETWHLEVVEAASSLGRTEELTHHAASNGPWDPGKRTLWHRQIPLSSF